MPKVMVLGAGNCQLSAVKRARELGLGTVVADYNEAPPAAAYADAHVRVSTFDIAGCLKAAQEQRVDAVLTVGTDQPVYTAAVIAEAMGLPSPISAELALNVTNKQRMKAIFAQAGIPNTPHVLIGRGASAGELGGLRAPYVIKPVDSQGQRGVAILDTPEQVLDHIGISLGFSREEQVLVEEYYANDELCVSGWVHEGRAHILTVTDRLSFLRPPSLGVCYAHRCPSKQIAHYAQIEALTCAITEAFGIMEGPLYYQLFWGEHGLYANEIAVRIGGAFEDVFIPPVCGFDILDAALWQSLGKTPDLSCLANYHPARAQVKAGVQLMFCAGGKISALTPLEEILALPGVLAAGYNYAVGDTVPATENATARLGHCVIVSGDDDIPELTANFWRKFRVLNERGENMALAQEI